MDELALSQRRPSSRDGFVLEVGFLVRHVHTGRLHRIIDIDFWGGAHDIGGHTLITELVTSDRLPLDSEPDISDSDEEAFDDGQVYAHEFCGRNGSFERTSFCERCDIYFCPEFVTWCFDSKPEREWFELAYINKYNHNDLWGPRLHRQKSSCQRCEADRPNGFVLWQQVRRWLRLRSAAEYWSRLAHHPKYVSTHAALASADLAAVLA